MKTKFIRVIAVIVDTHFLTLYKENGEKILIPQGDPRVKYILETATADILQDGYADVDVSHIVWNSYADVEDSSNGFVRFFRVAKKKLKAMFSSEGEDDGKPVHNMDEVVAEILSHAVSVKSPSFTERGLDNQVPIMDDNGSTSGKHTSKSSDETVVALVDGVLIPGVEKIRNQFTNAFKQSSTKGIEAFLTRITKVIKNRRHSIEDLLTFMERGDLPIADDGSILIYKILNLKGDRFYDCHTGLVPQWVGAYVCMNKSMVDSDRSNECSHGLHVARRGYLNSFNGDICVIAKVAPEDVIAVPNYDANKMRVCGYHIIGQLTDEQFKLLKNNEPITKTASGAVLLANAIAGNHIKMTHKVVITGEKGKGISVTPLDDTKKDEDKAIFTNNTGVEALPNEMENLAPLVKPLDVLAQKEKIMTRKELVQTLFKEYQELPTENTYQQLLAHKKLAKCSWDHFGITAPTPYGSASVTSAKVIKPKKNKPLSAAVKIRSLDKPSSKTALFAEPDKRHPPAPTAEAKAAVSGRSKVKPKVKKFAPVKPVAKGTYKERIAAIDVVDQDSAMDALILKRMSKKGWPELGVSPEKANHILKLTNQLK